MDVRDYTQARYGRLLEHAVELGAPEGEAAVYVDQVLLDQRRRIKRARDPDPLVREALERMVLGRREHDRGLLAVVVVLGAVLVSVGLAAVLYQPTPEPMPSLFAYTGEQAADRLEDAGYAVQLRPARACEPLGLVLGTDPRAGDLVADRGTITVRTAVPAGTTCLAVFGGRTDAWAFVAWARGLGPAPDVADQVTVVVDQGDPDTLTGRDASEREQWGDGLQEVADTAERATGTRNGMPSLTVSTGVPPDATCGIPRPDAVDGRTSLRFAIDPTPDDQTAACPLTVDLYRVDGAIDSVVVYTAAS